MINYFFQRLFFLIPTFIGITLITFIIVHFVPGDPAVLAIRKGMSNDSLRDPLTAEIIEQNRKLFGLDKPIHIQYFLWFKRLLLFDFGNSYKDNQPVIKKIKERLPVTLQLNIISIFLIYLFSIPLGVFNAVKYNSLSDKLITLFLFMLYSLPTFWVATMLILYLGGGDYLNLFPIYGLSSEGAENLNFFNWLIDRLWHLVLPVFCLTYGGFAYLSRYVKSNILEVLKLDFIRTARAKGLPEKFVIFKHTLKNSLIPVIVLVANIFPALFGGSVIIEQIFSINGLGKLSFDAILARDYPVIMAMASISAFLTLIGILISDFLMVLIDPRIKF
ncbi:MAG TPA: ABC transporter permease [bacterium]|nr:ABC transporter permease [bacterium]HOL47897.1 ABC transporter permease [bacterium]HPQ17911.1 ABC transporter permease [bacterium]